ncbi:MAG: hypothetical protein P1U57_02890 [Oleibacter sp.]|nr:hypothetical protein [Thalassolituus sp.]
MKIQDQESAKRRNTLLYGGFIGAGFGILIGAVAGISIEGAITGFIGGWIVGELISVGVATSNTEVQKVKHSNK